MSVQGGAPLPPVGRAPPAATFKHATKVSRQPLAPLPPTDMSLTTSPPLVLGNSAITHDDGAKSYGDDQEEVERLHLQIKKEEIRKLLTSGTVSKNLEAQHFLGEKGDPGACMESHLQTTFSM